MKKSIAECQQEELGPHQSSQLFLLRVWIERVNDQTPEDLAGKVQDPVSGQVHYFHRAMELVRILRRAISLKTERGIVEAGDNAKADAAAPKTKT